jgi:hypothetical protein
MSIVDPMETTEFRVGHAIRNLCSAIADIDDLRRSNEARRELQDTTSLADIELCRDRLSRILDNVGARA